MKYSQLKQIIPIIYIILQLCLTTSTMLFSLIVWLKLEKLERKKKKQKTAPSYI